MVYDPGSGLGAAVRVDLLEIWLSKDLTSLALLQKNIQVSSFDLVKYCNEEIH